MSRRLDRHIGEVPGVFYNQIGSSSVVTATQTHSIWGVNTSGGDVIATLPAPELFYGRVITVTVIDATNRTQINLSTGTLLTFLYKVDESASFTSNGNAVIQLGRTSTMVQEVVDDTTTAVTSNTVIPDDNSTPAIGEGIDTGLSVVIKPSELNHQLRWMFCCPVASVSSQPGTYAVFRDSTCVGVGRIHQTDYQSITGFGYIAAGGVAEQTWTVRFGPISATTGTIYLLSHDGSARFSTTDKMSLIITEWRD